LLLVFAGDASHKDELMSLLAQALPQSSTLIICGTQMYFTIYAVNVFHHALACIEVPPVGGIMYIAAQCIMYHLMVALCINADALTLCIA